MPPWLRRAWDAWKRFAFWLGDKQATLIYTLIWVLVLGPIALIRRLVSDPLCLRGRDRPTFWRPRVSPPPSLVEARRQ